MTQEGGGPGAGPGPPDGLRAEQAEADVLSALARLALQAAFSYEASARAFAQLEPLRARLRALRDEHLKAVSALDGLLRLRQAPGTAEGAHTGASVPQPPPADEAPSGGADVLLALLTTEVATRGCYLATLELSWDARTREVLERHVAEAQRRIVWLSEQEVSEASLPHG